MRFLATLLLMLAAVSVHASDPVAGERKYVLCAGCHGPGGGGNEALKYPRIAGRDAGYIAAQLQAFRSGARANATMQAMTAGLNDRDIDNLSAYIATFD
jgi:cytochrome c553